MSEAVELHAHFGLSYVAATCPFCTNDEIAEKLRTTSDEALLRTFASLTHRMHVARLKNDAVKELELRAQRNIVEGEILRRMRRE